MRRIRFIIGLATLVCACGITAVPALANKHKAKKVFGEFKASYPDGAPISPTSPAPFTGTGELSRLILADGGLKITECAKELKASGTVTAEKSEVFTENVKFTKCYGRVSDNGNGFVKVHEKVSNFTIRMEFHSNHSVQIGAEEGTEVTIKPTKVVVDLGSKKSQCVITIPEQTIPTKATTKPEHEYEAAAYETEEEPAKLKKFPAGFQEKLDIEWEFENEVISWEKPSAGCEYVGGGDGTKDETPETPAYGQVVYKKGTFEAETEELTIKNGDLGFETKAEVEAE